MIKIVIKNRTKLVEMPITGISRAGTYDKPSSERKNYPYQTLDAKDLKFINSDKALGKIVEMWAGSKVRLNLVFCNTGQEFEDIMTNGIDDSTLASTTFSGDVDAIASGMGSNQVGFLGKHKRRLSYSSGDRESSSDYADEDDNDYDVYDDYNFQDDPETASELINSILKRSNYTRQNDSINFIIIGNWGPEKVPLSGWIVAHKLSHALLDTSTPREVIMNLIRLDFYHKLKRQRRPRKKIQEEFLKIVQDLILLVPSKSGRTGKVSTAVEALHELFAYYILNNKVKFLESGEEKVLQELAKLGTDSKTARSLLNFLKERLSFYFQHILENAVGSTLID